MAKNVDKTVEIKATVNNKIKQSKGDKIFGVINYTLLTLVLLVVVYPLVYVVSASFSDPLAVSSGQVWLWPVGFNLRGYEVVFQHPDIMRSFVNSIGLTVGGTLFSVAVTILAAYPLSRKNLYGSRVITFFFAFTMLFGGGLIPSFLLINKLGLYNTYWALILPGAVGVYNVIVARTFFQTSIPEELYEAGQLDGCDDIGYLARVVLPLSAPIVAVLAMFYAIGFWNSYFGPMIYLSDKTLFPLQIVLKNILVSNSFDGNMMANVDVMEKQRGLQELIKYSIIVVSSLPMLIIYPFVQKHFVKGVMIGAVKG
ncbi:MAG: carbohydrate ABC transporter permease [Cellulosilyticaceae bacterium]